MSLWLRNNSYGPYVRVASHVFYIYFFTVMNTKFAVLCLLLLVAVAQNCIPNNQLDDTEAAIITAESGSSQFALASGQDTTTYMHSFTRAMGSSPQVALALTSFDATPVTGLSFGLDVGVTTNSQAQIILTTPWSVSQWRSLKFNLLASSRSDI